MNLYYCGRLGTTDLVNKIKICTSLIKLFHFENVYHVVPLLKLYLNM